MGLAIMFALLLAQTVSVVAIPAGISSKQGAQLPSRIFSQASSPRTRDENRGVRLHPASPVIPLRRPFNRQLSGQAQTEIQWEYTRDRPPLKGTQRRLRVIPRPIAKFNLTASLALVTDVRYVFPQHQRSTIDQGASYNPLEDFKPFGGLMMGRVQQIGGRNTEEAFGVNEGDIVVFKNQLREKKELYLRENGTMISFLRPQDILGTMPNISCGPECLSEFLPHPARILVKPKLRRDNLHPYNPPSLRGKRFWCTVEKVGNLSGQEEYNVGPGDKILLPRMGVTVLDPTSREPMAVVPRSLVIGYRLQEGWLTKPFGDGIIIEQCPQDRRRGKILVGKVPVTFPAGRVMALGTGTHPLASPELPMHKFSTDVASYVMFEARGSRLVEWPATQSSRALPGKRFFVIHESQIRGTLPKSSRGIINIREIQPRAGYMIAELADPRREMKEILPLYLPGRKALREARIIKKGPPPTSRRVGMRNTARDWINDWKKEMNMTVSAPSDKRSFPSAKLWIENWKMRTKMNLSDAAISARTWIEKWKLTRTPDIYQDYDVGDRVLVQFTPNQRRFSQLAYDDEGNLTAYALINANNIIAKYEE